MNEHQLYGCRDIPLSNYLKALGIFTILAREHPETKACWKNGVFVIYSNLSKKEIIDFMMDDYKPVPVINPLSWNKYKTTTKDVKSMLGSKFGHRLEPYRKTLDDLDGIFKEFMVIYGLKKIKKEDIDKVKKLTLLKLCRNRLQDNIIPIFDAVGIAGENACSFAPILGTGFNDGAFDMVENFIKHIGNIFDPEGKIKSKKWLHMSMYDSVMSDEIEGDAAPLIEGTSMGHNTNAVGGSNSGYGFDGTSILNPWDYILMIEGTVLFAGSMSKQLSSSIDGKAVFPFSAGTSNAGYPTSSNEEKNEGNSTRGEMWMPIWESPASYREVRHVFGEGRAQFGNRYARTGTEFARAAVTLGTERKISQFRRFCIMKRKGKAYLTINAGKIQVKNRLAAGLLEDVDRWYERMDRTRSKNTARLDVLMKKYDECVMKFCSIGRKKDLQQILICIGKLEKYASIVAELEPLRILRAEWIEECYDGTAEFRLAASLASIYDKGIGGIRKNLEDVVDGKWGPKYEKSPSCVWNENGDMLKNMVQVLRRRCLDGKISKCDTAPINGKIYAGKSDIIQFLYGKLDAGKIGDLILPLSMTDMRNINVTPWKNEIDVIPVPEAYGIIKMLYPSKRREKIPYEMSVLNSLSAGRINDAYSKASYILHAHGMSPLRHSKKRGAARNTTISDIVKKHLAASLLFPISDEDRFENRKDVITVPET